MKKIVETKEVNIKRAILSIIWLLLLQFALDILFVYIYPEVSPLRASFIGVSSFLILSLTYLFIKNITRNKKEFVDPLTGALSIFSSAFFGALLVQAGYLASKSNLSGEVHIILLALSYVILDHIHRKMKNF